MHFWLKPQLDSLLAERERLHHALLITGSEGMGKVDFARAIANALLCETPLVGGRACGHCAACRWFSQGSHPDFRALLPEADDPLASESASATKKPSRFIRIEQVRQLAPFVEVVSHRGAGKVVLVTPAEAMNPESANALLKTLEEPPAGMQFLLVTSHPERITATIRSRCRTVRVMGPERSACLAWLAQARGASAEVCATWLDACSGSPLRALALSEPDALAQHRTILDAIAALPESGFLSSADALAQLEPSQWARLLHEWCTDLACVQAGAPARFFPDRHPRLVELASASSAQAVLAYECWLAGLMRLVSHPLNARLLVEDALSRYCGAVGHARAGR